MVPCAALPSLSESSMAAEFFRVRECMMDRWTLEMKRQWSTFDGEVLLRTCTPLRQCLVTPRCGGLGQRLCSRPRGSDDALGQWLSAFQDDPTTQRCRVAA